MWQEVKNSSGGSGNIASGVAAIGATEINCGFRPKYICISTISYITIYDADFSQTMAYRANDTSPHTSEPYTIAGNTGRGLNEINSTGFKFDVGTTQYVYWFAARD